MSSTRESHKESKEERQDCLSAPHGSEVRLDGEVNEVKKSNKKKRKIKSD